MIMAGCTNFSFYMFVLLMIIFCVDKVSAHDESLPPIVNIFLTTEEPNSFMRNYMAFSKILCCFVVSFCFYNWGLIRILGLVIFQFRLLFEYFGLSGHINLLRCVSAAVLWFVFTCNVGVIDFEIEPYLAGELTEQLKPFDVVVPNMCATRCLNFTIKCVMFRILRTAAHTFIHEHKCTPPRFNFKKWDRFFLFPSCLLPGIYWVPFIVVWIFFHLGYFLTLFVYTLYIVYDSTFVHNSAHPPKEVFSIKPVFRFLYKFLIKFASLFITLSFGFVYIKGISSFFYIWSMLLFYVNSFFSSWTTQADRDYSQSKADRRAKRSARGRYKNEKEKAVEQYCNAEKCRRRKSKIMEEKTSKVQAAHLELDDLLSQMHLSDDPDTIRGLGYSMIKCTKRLNKLTKSVSKLGEELSVISTRSDSTFQHLMTYNGGAENILESVMNAMSQMKFSGDKVKIGLGIYAEFSNFCRCSTKKDYVDFCISVLSRFVPGECISNNLGKLQEIFKRELKGDLEVQGIKTWIDLPNRPLTKILKSIIGLVVVLALGSGYVKKESLPDLVSFALDIPKKIESTDVMGYVYKAIQFCSSTLPFYNGKMCWDDLLNGNTSAQIIANEMSVLSYQYMCYKTGDPLAKGDKGLKLPLADCFSRACSLEDRLSKELKFKKGSEASVLRRELEKVSGWKCFFTEKLSEEEIVIAPYVMSFRSIPGVGKTSLQRFFAIFVAKNNGYPHSEHDIASRNPDDKFDSRGWKSIMMVDDYHQCDISLRETNETLYIIRAANMQRMMGVSADLESKGRIPINPNVLTISGNGSEWRPEQDITEPSAFLRRLNLDFTDILPLPQYRKRDSHQLDSSLVNGATDLWQMKVGYFVVTTNNNDEPIGVKYYLKKDYSTTVDVKQAYNFKVSEISDFILRDSRSHYANQKLVKGVLDDIGKTWCDHEVDGVTKSYVVGACPLCNALPPVNVVPTELEAVAQEAVAAVQPMEHQSVFGFSAFNCFPIITTLCGWIYYSGFVQMCISSLPPQIKWFFYHVLWSCVFYYFGVFMVVFGSGLLRLRRVGFSGIVGKWLMDRSSIFLKDACERSKNAIREFVDKHKAKILIILAITLVLACYHYTHQNAMSFGNKPDQWAEQHVNHEVFLNDAKTTSYDDVSRMIQSNIVYFKLTYSDGVRDMGNAIPYRGHYYIMNKHYFAEGRVPVKMEITRYDISAPQCRYTQDLNKDFVFSIPNTDLVVVFLPKTMRCVDFSKFYCDRFPVSPVKCLQYHKNSTGKVFSQMVVARPMPCKVANDYYDKCFMYKGSAFKGLCGAPLVSISKRPVILGIHWAGSSEGLDEGSSVFIDKNWVEQAIINISAKTMIKEGATFGNMSMQSYVETPLCGKNSFSYLGDVGTLTYLGKSDAPIVNNKKTVVMKTELHDVIKERTGYEPRGPFVEANWAPIFDAQQAMKHDCDSDIKWNFLKMARDDWFVNAFRSKKVVSDFKNLRVLTDQESLDGTSVPGEEKMKLNTSKGASYLGFGGKKSAIFERSLEGVTTPPLGFFDKIKELEDYYDEGYTVGMPFLQCLKQEVLFKNKARIFSANPVEHLVLIRKYFLTLASLLRRHNEVFENAIGANVYGPDWKEIVDYVTKFGENRMGYGDYKNYDQSLRAIEILVAFSCLIHLAEKSGNFLPRSIRIMWGIAHDIANPIYIGNGAFYGASGTSASGHPLTTILNCVTNSLRHRVVYYMANITVAKPLYVENYSCAELNELNPDLFSNYVALMVQGDDNVYSSSEKVVFGMVTMRDYLGKMGIVYTSADKEGDIEMEYGTLEDMTFLKRSVGHIPEIPIIVAPLAEKSIWKALMMEIPSDVLTPSQQLAEAINASMNECFYHGRQFYDEMSIYLQSIIAGKSVAPFVDAQAFRPFDSRVQLWHETFMVKPEC